LRSEGKSIESQCLSSNPGPMDLSKLRQVALNLSLSRANAVRDSMIAYAKSQNPPISLDPSQFGVVGLGITRPGTPNCKPDAANDIDFSCYPVTELEWNA